MAQSLTADIQAFVRKSEQRMKAVVFNSLSDVTELAQTPTAKGGRMRVKTGFLRASGRASKEGMPSGNGQRPEGARDGQFQYDGQAVNAVLNTMKLGDTFYFGWVANYAEVRELHDGFLVTATQKWQQIVDRNSERFRDR